MSTLPAEPSFKDKISASWMRDLLRYVRSITPVAGPGMKVSRGPNGTVFSSAKPAIKTAVAADQLHPWKVFAVGKSEEVDHFFEIYIPDGSITVGANEVEVDGIEETEVSKRFTFACESDVGESSTLYLVVYRDEEEESEEDEKNYKSVLAVNIEEYKDDESVRSIIPIAELAVVEGEEYDRGKVVSQMQKDAIVLDDFDVPTDKVSIDKVTKKDAEDPDALQLKNFDNNESDGSQGLVQRIRVVKDGEDSFHLEADGAEVFLVARVKGKLKYIPLSGSKGKDQDEGRENPCDHPGDTPGTGKEGGVSPDDEEPHGVPAGGGVPADGGGVPADGDQHQGDPCPDCSPNK